MILIIYRNRALKIIPLLFLEMLLKKSISMLQM